MLQEYNIHWEYIPGKQNIVADVLSRVNIEKGTFDTEQEDIGKVFHIIQSREDLEGILNQVKEQQTTNLKLTAIKERLEQGDPTIIPYYCSHNDFIFTRPTPKDNYWKLYVPKVVESPVILDYHSRYRHMGPLKVIRALQEHMYMKGCLLYTSRCV